MDNQSGQYMNGPREDNGIRMSREPIDARQSPRNVEDVCHNWRKFHQDDERRRYPWADRFVMGFPLPVWQRPFVWTEEQQKRFVLSVWSKADIGSYMVNSWDMRDNETFVPSSNLLLDGQQRLTTLERYLQDSFAVDDVNGVARHWSEVPWREQRRFMTTTFTRSEVNTFDERELRMIYDLRNFGGTPHAECERALRPD
ncbi:DUF262 domain-containing protein [Burkholderia cenocepacia]|uniref:DUF262 domain-containing protein n=1 Tax=Burkholderia cenocepacia TaxID=95486 RepID=UPI000761A903|nr:DUF262 domain-containing protein [Burkholderia cenocepacia]KWU19102.1 hypothetical protein AS149_12710 [Burkholderia cenocepacia]